jgi:hypothetical protein
VVPNGLAEGEPMHVNFELVMWIMTAAIVSAACRLYDPPGESARRGVRRLAIVAVSACALALSAFMVRAANGDDLGRGGLPLHFDYDVVMERNVRARLANSLRDGNCFGYRRRYVIDAGAPYDPDAVIAATGCPVINGRRWRGYLGDNQPDTLKRSAAVKVGSGRPFSVVHIP